MKRKSIFKIFIFVLFSLFSVSCVTEAETNNKANYVDVCLNVPEYEQENQVSSIYNAMRTIIPSAPKAEEFSLFKLTGTNKSNNTVAPLIKTWTSFSEMQSDTLSLFIGVWDFKLTAYRNIDGVDKVYASGKLNSVELSVYDEALNNITALNFSMDFSECEITTADFNLEIYVPFKKCSKANVKFNPVDGPATDTSGVNVIPINVELNGKSYIYFEKKDVTPGDYKIQVDFYTSTNGTNEVTASRMYIAKLVPGQISKGKFEVTSLNNKYQLTFDYNIPAEEDPALTITFVHSLGNAEFNESTSVILPDTISRLGYNFDGWYDNAACEGSQITKINEGTKNSVTVYAKWIEQDYDKDGTVSGGIYEELNGNLSTNIVYSKADTPVVYSYKLGSTNVTNSLTNIEISFWSEGYNISSDISEYIVIDSDNNKFIVKKGIPAGTDLSIKIAYSYNGVAGYEDEFALTIEDAPVIASETALSSYLAELAANGVTETYVKMSGTPDYASIMENIVSSSTIDIYLDLSETNLTSISTSGLKEFPNLIGVELPNSLTTIGNYAFSYCTNLKEIYVPDSVIAIGTDAFSNDGNLLSVRLSSNITSIGTFAFKNCSSIGEFFVPSSVNTIMSYAFLGCTNLTDIIFENTKNWYRNASDVSYPDDFSNLNNILISEDDVKDSGKMATYLINSYQALCFYRNYAAD